MSTTYVLVCCVLLLVSIVASAQLEAVSATENISTTIFKKMEDAQIIPDVIDEIGNALVEVGTILYIIYDTTYDSNVNK